MAELDVKCVGATKCDDVEGRGAGVRLVWDLKGASTVGRWTDEIWIGVWKADGGDCLGAAGT